MLKYLKAAFFVRPIIQGLGAIPANVIALVCLGILGFANIGFWFLGLGLEAAFLLLLSTNPRFQHVVDALEKNVSSEDFEQKRRALIQQLAPDSQKRLHDIEVKCDKIISISKDSQADEFTTESNADALKRLNWVYLKLLLSQQNLRAADFQTSYDALKQEVAEIETELKAATVSDTLRQSKSATLAILHKRMDNLQRRDQTLEEIESDLTRIEAQVDLALENVTLRDRPSAIATNVDLASNLLDGGFYGDAESDVTELDQAFLKPEGKVSQ